MSTAPAVEKGQVLLLREDSVNGLPVRYKLWTVAGVKRAATGRASVRLLGWAPGCLMEATATFPDGLVAEPWQVFGLSQNDLAHCWKTRCGTPTNAERSSPESASGVAGVDPARQPGGE